jgi:hypothetical protein
VFLLHRNAGAAFAAFNLQHESTMMIAGIAPEPALAAPRGMEGQSLLRCVMPVFHPTQNGAFFS